MPMKELRSSLMLILSVSFFLALACVAHAQENRTFVSAVGDDANNCRRVTPCKTFTGAITRTNSGGEIDVLDTGGFGAIFVNKPVTIDGGGFLASSLISGTNAVNVTAGQDDTVILKHLSIASVPGTGGELGTNGIRINTVGALFVIDCLIKNFGSNGIDFEPSTGGKLFVTDSNIVNNGTGALDAGIFVKSGSTSLTAVAVVERSRIASNRNGVVARDRSRVSISNSLIAENRAIGLLAAPDSNASVEVNVESSIITFNGIGIRSGTCAAKGPAAVRISNVSVTSNEGAGLNHSTEGPTCGRGEIISAKNNTILGNHPDGEPTSSPGQK